jgi:cephalosporin-C deacetylase-like acetyl esterase
VRRVLLRDGGVCWVKLVVASLLTCFVVTGPLLGQNEDFSVLSRWMEWSDAPNFLHHHLNSLAFEKLTQRREKIESLKTGTDWKSRQVEVRDLLRRIVGPFPEKSPLNARVMGVVEKDRYRVEKIVFESRPDFFVTGCLFIPQNLQGKAPAILNVIGHTGIAFRAASYQGLILNLVLKGFIVFAMDPIGQGERLQYYDAGLGRSVVGGPTSEHSYVGRQCFIAGSSLARYFTWDGIRAIDYLISRPEVDASRIGVTGISGGGTQTSYISAIDDRVLAAAPTCYICGFQRLFESIGPQDAEQNFNGGVSAGIDHADFLEIRAPKPTLVVATTRDFFSVQGAREVVAEARDAFRALGKVDNLQLVEDDLGHGYTQKNREAIYAFFQKHLTNPGDSAEEEDIAFLSGEELKVTPTGQVIDSLGGETVFSLNQRDSEALIGDLRLARDDLTKHLDGVRRSAAGISGFQPPEGLPEVVFRGKYQRQGYDVEMYAMTGEGMTLVPFLLFRPRGAEKSPGVLYLHPDGKAAGAEPGGEIELLVKLGYAVLAPDLPGSGELGSVNNTTAFLAVQIGRSLVGVRTGDIIRCLQFLKSHEEINGSEIIGIARQGMGIPLLHAAALDSRIGKVALIDPLVSFSAVVTNRFYELPAADMMANVLTAYDVPDLEASVAPRPLLIVSPRDHLGKRLDRKSIDSELSVVTAAYQLKKAQGSLQIQNLEAHDSAIQVVKSWLSVR